MIEMNTEIVQYLPFFLLCLAVPVILLLFLCMEICESKRKDGSLNEKKEYYWLKGSSSQKKVEENNCQFSRRLLLVWSQILLTFYILICVGAKWNLPDMDDLNQICWSVLGLLGSTFAGMGIVLANKKKIHLGIDPQDVVKTSHIPGAMANMYVAVVYMVIGWIMSNITSQESLKVITYLAKVLVISAAGWSVFNMMIALRQMIEICLNVGQHELRAFESFRSRIIDVVKLDDSQEICAHTVERITTSLLRKNAHGLESLNGVRFRSILVEQREQKCLKKLEFKVNIGILMGFGLLMSLGILGTLAEMDEETVYLRVPIWNEMVIIGVTLIIYIIGCVRKSWLLLFGSRYYFEFSYKNNSSRKVKYKMGDPATLWPQRRYKAVLLMESLLGFYKMLLYSKRGCKYTHNVIKRVEYSIDEKNKTSCHTILLLLYYAEYEKIFLKLESERRQTQVNRCCTKNLCSDKSFAQKVNKKVKKKKVVDYALLERYIEFDKKTSVEYQLASAILNHVYREPLIENKSIVPQTLSNYRFECFFEHIREQCTMQNTHISGTE